MLNTKHMQYYKHPVFFIDCVDHSKNLRMDIIIHETASDGRSILNVSQISNATQ